MEIMGDYERLVLAGLALASTLSLIAFLIAMKILPNMPWLQAIGRKIHGQKMAMLKKPPLSYYQRAVDHGDFVTGLSIIAVLILLKSLASGLLGLITIFYLPLGVATIPALAAEHGDNPVLNRWVTRVTAWQTFSHILAASLGFAASWLWISAGSSPIETFKGSLAFTGAVAIASLVTGLIAAWMETAGHMRDGFLKPENPP